MKSLTDILNHKYKVIHKGEEILVSEHALNLAPEINKSFHKNKLIHDLYESEGEILKILGGIEQNHDAKIKKSDTDLIKLCLEPYENRTIEVEKENVDYELIKEILENHGVRSAIAHYKYSLFEITNKDLWNKHMPGHGDRIVLYAFPRKNGAKALEEMAEVIGRLVTKKRKKYSKYASRNYGINDPHGLHARPAAALVQTASKYKNADIWVRTENKEVNAKSIMQLFLLEATAGKPLTLLCKPYQESEPFYKEIESIPFEDKTLFSRIDYLSSNHST